jgi:P27 family predicted phage terminase small subunit
MKPKQSTAPAHLSVAGKAMWRSLSADFELDDAAALSLLRAACEAFDRAEQARKLIARDGPVITDRFNQRKAHPCIAIERDSRAQMVSALRALRIQPE